jgi:hypothetical protein
MIINTSSNMGDTTVSIQGNQTFGSGGAGNTVKRCYEIAPTTSQTAAITFYYLVGQPIVSQVRNLSPWGNRERRWCKSTLRANSILGQRELAL